ncbi:hypothetical protein EYF80_006297 [Liparis tanakae]|uniref:Uncharacterized protein n=1 Tax=Liparis tanakae TaxID=230148 RepID=A0A4Z2IZL0_9TELE|nr:hypothetical protein EYF80_006297 [Liparis tanakae]
MCACTDVLRSRWEVRLQPDSPVLFLRGPRTGEPLRRERTQHPQYTFQDVYCEESGHIVINEAWAALNIYARSTKIRLRFHFVSPSPTCRVTM